MAYGQVHYHGFWLKRHQISSEDQEQAKRLRPLRRGDARQADGKQVSKPVAYTRVVKYFSWNCGGLPISKFDEVMLWADQNEFTMFALQETRRKSSCCWISGNYQIFQSGDAVSRGPSYAGVLLAVRKPIQISYHEIIPGRLLHVCLDGLKQNLHTMC